MHLGLIIIISLIRFRYNLIISNELKVTEQKRKTTHNRTNDEFLVTLSVLLLLHHHHFNPIYIQSLHSFAEPNKKKRSPIFLSLPRTFNHSSYGFECLSNEKMNSIFINFEHHYQHIFWIEFQKEWYKQLLHFLDRHLIKL